MVVDITQVFEKVKEIIPSARYNEQARTISAGETDEEGEGVVHIVTGGTSDIPVAEEAAETALIMGRKVEKLYDVGVAGIHRLLNNADLFKDARVVIVAAGMEGALPSVVGGLVNCPVIAVPTSIGYGASFGGIAALLGMLNSCASNVLVTNIDNGFRAGYVASLISKP
jgi:NCAIR mutase (PurE)-related protein